MFTTAKCGHCDKTGTKLQIIEPEGGAFKQSAIVCKWCNSILGVTGYFDAGKVAKDVEAKVTDLQQKLGQVERQLQQVVFALQRR